MQFIKIRFNSPEYAEALKIRCEVFIGEQKVPEEIEIDEHECGSHHFLATVDGQPAATARLRLKGDYIKFERIAVLKKFRGQGVGKNLMDELLGFARDTYPELVPFMHSQESAVGFYEKLGWMKKGPLFTEAGIPHQAMIYTQKK
jgi:predicted GNAT family N-acyltransferase